MEVSKTFSRVSVFRQQYEVCPAAGTWVFLEIQLGRFPFSEVMHLGARTEVQYGSLRRFARGELARTRHGEHMTLHEGRPAKDLGRFEVICQSKKPPRVLCTYLCLSVSTLRMESTPTHYALQSSLRVCPFGTRKLILQMHIHPQW